MPLNRYYSQMFPDPDCDGIIHTIRLGDTLYRIVMDYNMTVDDIINANPGLDPNRLQVGMKICIPVKLD